MIYGVIAEYNPFHNGHKYQLDYIRRQDADAKIIVAMSGHITQRGELPVLDKWTRAQAAVENGADLVIELPAVFTLRSAEGFAYGGVNLLAKCGINRLAFSLEYPDKNELYAIAEAIDSPEVQEAIRSGLSNGLAYPAAVASAIEGHGFSHNIPTDNILHEANSILAIEYIRALNKTNSRDKIDILPIRRVGTGHSGEAIESSNSPVTASGSKIRNLISNSKPTALSKDRLRAIVPERTYADLCAAMDKNSIASVELMAPALRWRLTTMTLSELRNIYSINEGLEFTLKKCSSLPTVEAIVKALTNRRYTKTRIQRMLIYVLLGITTDYVKKMDTAGPLYVRPLAFNHNGQVLLKKIKKSATVEVITKPATIINRREFMNMSLSYADNPLINQLYLDILTTSLFAQSASASLNSASPDSHTLEESILLDFLISPKIF